MAWIGDNVPYEQRQATLARFLSGPLLGMVSGQFLGGLFADTLGWRWGLVFIAGIYVVISALLHLEIKRNPLIHAKPAHSFTTGTTVSFLAQVLAVLRLPWARIVLVTAFIEGMTAFGTLAFVPSYLHARFGISLTLAGALTAVFGLGGLLYTIIAARIVGRFGERGLALGAAPLLGVAFLGYFLGPEWYWALPSSFVGGLGFYMLHNTLQTNATQMAPKSRGTAVSLFVAIFFLSQSVGVSLAAVVVDTVGASWLFIPCAIILPLVGIGFAYALRFRKA
jgi:predicted MFS family arabinose efflux permease